MSKISEKNIEKMYEKLSLDTIEKSEWQKLVSGDSKRYKYVFGHMIEDDDKSDWVTESKDF